MMLTNLYLFCKIDEVRLVKKLDGIVEVRDESIKKDYKLLLT